MSMNSGNKPHSKRKRGVGLSASGLRRLNQAIHYVEVEENQGKQFSAEELSDRTGISTSTLSRLWAARTGVDRRTLHLLFNALNMDLLDSDIQQLGEEAKDISLSVTDSSTTSLPIRYPSGPVPVDSQLYISRSGVDDRAFQEILQPGCVIRIKAPSGFGKSSLVLRLVHHANQLGYATVAIDLQQTDTETLADTHAFLRWFCVVLSLKLNLKSHSQIDEYWDELLGSKLSTTLYMREAILAQLERPLVLVINEVERIFEYPDTAKNMLPLLRSWHEEAQHDSVWKKLRLVVAYSTDAYLPLDINQSPFNIGLPISLTEFNREQVQKLASLYGAIDNEKDCKTLLSLTGGNPSLVGIALYHLQQSMTLDKLLECASTLKGIYHNHLQRLLAQINKNPQWVDCLKLLVQGDGGIALDPILAYKLEGMGLIKASSDGWQLSCELYRAFFPAYLFN